MKNIFFAFFLSIVISTAALAAPQHSAVATIDGLVCDFCARALEKTFGKQPEVDNIKVDLTAKTVLIAFKDGKSLTDDQITKLIVDAGYNVRNIAHGETAGSGK